MNPEFNLVTRLNLTAVTLIDRCCFQLPELATGRYGLHFVFEAQYPLAQHLRYVRARDGQPLSEKSRLRFVEMDFAPEPPGIPVGPWPGWRGIPDMPEVRVELNGKQFTGRFNFWGDEFETGQLRNFVLVQIEQPGAHELLLNFSDSRLKPVSLEIYAAARPKIKPKPVCLRPALRNHLPRLFFSAEALPELQMHRKTTHARIWQEIELLLANRDLEFELTPESKTLPGPERLNEQDLAVLTAFYARLNPSAEAFATASRAFETLLNQALAPDYEPMHIDTQSGECLFSLCVAFDWLAADWSQEKRNAFQEKMFTVAERVWQHLGYAREDFAQAHFLGCSHGLLAFSFLFWDEHPRAREWADWLHGVFAALIPFFPADGFYPHGINLWIYEHIFLLRYLELWRHCAGIDFWPATDYWRNSSRFRGATISPDRQRSLTFGDPQYRVTGDAWLHYLIAARTGSEAAQALACKLAGQPTTGVDFRSVTPRRRVWEFLWFDPTVPAAPAQATKLFFPDGEQVFWRSRIQAPETLVTVRAGAPLGRARYQWGEWSGFGHSDPANGGFLISIGDWFCACGPGPVYRRDTRLHNCVTFDGHGQIGDGMVWAPEFVPADRFASVLSEITRPDFQEIAFDLRPAYLDFLGVKKYTRRLTGLISGLQVVDEIELTQPRRIEWNFHTFGEIRPNPDSERLAFHISSESNSMELCFLEPSRLEWETGLTEFVPAYPNAGERDRFLCVTHFGLAATFLVRLEFNPTRVAKK